ncbi:MAG: hypothetical protein LBK01_06790, partial [Burkholderiaceae bacterium]|nr:hypothetical protein [Burkholderiaceae bacterium]
AVCFACGGRYALLPEREASRRSRDQCVQRGESANRFTQQCKYGSENALRQGLCVVRRAGTVRTDCAGKRRPPSDPSDAVCRFIPPSQRGSARQSS